MLPGHHDPEVRGDRYVESLIPIPDPGGRTWNEASRLNEMISLMYIMLLVHYSSIYLLFVLAPVSSTFMHALIRPYSLWIYNSIIGKRKLVLRLNKEQNL